MKNRRWLSVICISLLMGLNNAQAGQPAARMGDMTAHGGTINAGLPTVLIGSQPAARLGDMHVCPMITPPYIPHVGGPIATGSSTVLIGGMPAARVGDMATCVGPPDVIVTGCPTVLIEGGAPGGGEYRPSEESTREDTTATPQLKQPQIIHAPVVLQPKTSGLPSPQDPSMQKEIVGDSSDKNIIASGKITIQSKGDDIQLVTGLSTITLKPDGRIIIEGRSIEFKADTDIILDAMTVSIKSSLQTDIRGTTISSIADATHTIRGAIVEIN